MISSAFFERGLRYDSNLCLHLQPRLVPLHHATGLLRFPVFLEDDVLLARERDRELKAFLPLLKTPGLKIFNFHPQHVALNTPDVEWYAGVRHGLDDGRARTYSGRGVRTLLMDLLSAVCDSPGLGVFSLAQLFDRTTGSGC